MSSERLQTGGLVFMLLAVGAAAWSFQLRPPLDVLATSLDDVPYEINGWTAIDQPLEETVESILRADYNVQRAYTHPVGGLLWFYIGYYGTDRGGRSDHTPEVCYESAGWTILDARVLRVGNELHANELLVEQADQRRLVLFWFQSHRDTGMVNALEQTLDRLFGRLIGGRADGAFVRLSMPLDAGGETTARSRLMSFATQLDPLLSQHWPKELPATP